MVVIDADGHVEESTAMFKCLPDEYYSRRPLPLGFDQDTIYGPANAVWLIDGEVYPKLQGKGGTIFRTPTLMESAKRKRESIPAQELTDVAARLRDLDRVGIDRQVVFPSLFLTTTTEDLVLETELLRAYNNFLGNACTESGGRISYAALVPIRDVPGSIAEVKRARTLGASCVMLHGMAWDKCLGDERLYPFYEAVAESNIPVCVHLGWGCPAMTDVFDASTNFYGAVLPVLMGFHSLVGSGVLDIFPKLRLGFLEAGSQWVAYLIRQLRHGGIRGKRLKMDPADYFREGRVYVGCEADEDINYLVTWIGEDALVIGSDYPHGDPSREEDIVGELDRRSDLTPRLREKMLSTNPRRLYGF